MGLFDTPPIDMNASPTLAPKGFAQSTPTIRPNSSVPAAAVPRVSRQARAVLALLRIGRTSVTDLKTVASQYNARIYELRQAGYVITNDEVDQITGESWYSLRSEPKAIADGVFVVPAGSGGEFKRAGEGPAISSTDTGSNS